MDANKKRDILLYAIFTNEYTRLISHWLEHVASRFCPGETDIIIFTDKPPQVDIPDNVRVEFINSHPMRNEELCRKCARHKYILETYGKGYKYAACLQSNIWIGQTLRSSQLRMEVGKFYCIKHARCLSSEVPELIAHSCCRAKSVAYVKDTSTYKIWAQAGIMFGCRDTMLRLNEECLDWQIEDEASGALWTDVPYHDESYLNAWRIKNPGSVNVISNVSFTSWNEVQACKTKTLFVVVDKPSLGIPKRHGVIVCDPFGNVKLGNFMFMVAAMYAYARSEGKELIFAKFNPWLKVFKRRFYQQEMSQSPIQYIAPYKYRPIPPGITGIIAGYFQSSKWFRGYEDEIRDLYSALWSENREEGLAAIHIRLGDYMKEDIARTHRTPSADYIRKAVGSLPSTITVLEVFSDDPDLAEERIKEAVVLDGIELRIMQNIDEVATIRRITEATAFIMSASSFSWWAAWLGRHNTVIVEDTWYNDHKIPTEDIYEPHWVRISTK